MKTLIVGPIFDGSGYSESMIQYAMALDHVGVDVAVRQVRMTTATHEPSDKIKSFNQKDLKNIDTIIQYNLPSEFAYKGGVLNVGAFAYETSGFPHTDWKFGLNLMDQVLVSSNHQRQAVINTCGPRIQHRVTVIPHPVDTSKFDQEYELMDFDTTKETIKFYSIAEFNKRKNLSTLIVAYYTAFDINDNVLLILKTNFSNPEQEKEFKEFCLKIKKDLGRFKNPEYYPKIALVPNRLLDKHICSLHKTGDIFVSTSHGEAICLPFLDAMGFGNPCIVPRHSSFLDYRLLYDDDLIVDSHESIAFGVKNAPEGLYTCDEKWGNVPLVGLTQKMRWAYNNIKEITAEQRTLQRQDYIKTLFGYDSVGPILKEVISAEAS